MRFHFGRKRKRYICCRYIECRRRKGHARHLFLSRIIPLANDRFAPLEDSVRASFNWNPFFQKRTRRSIKVRALTIEGLFCTSVTRRLDNVHSGCLCYHHNTTLARAPLLLRPSFLARGATRTHRFSHHMQRFSSLPAKNRRTTALFVLAKNRSD